jgi:hypothetical protein
MRASFFSSAGKLEHDPEKWIPVFGKDHAPLDKLERDDDPKESHSALAVDTINERGAARRADGRPATITLEKL